jgi:tetratricopeptide (TPR) repeat protein
MFQETRMKLLYSKLNQLTSNTHQLTRIIILTGVALVLAVASFGGYYYYDRYYRPQPKISTVSLDQAEKMVREDPQNQDKRISLAETYMINRRYEDALAQASQVMAANPENQHAWLVVGVANVLGGTPASAIEPLQKYVDANKNTEMPGLNKSLQSAAYYLGDAYMQLNQPDKAIVPLEMTLSWNRTDSDTLYKLGIAYTSLKKYDRALAAFQEAITFVPDFTEAYQAMAVAYAANNQPELVDYANGMVAFSRKDYQVALALLLKSADAKQDFPPIFDGLGLTYEALNDLPKAKASYELALKWDPNDITATANLQRVEALLKK